MPSYKGHIVGGGCAYALVLAITGYHHTASLPTLAEWLVITLAGSLFPDIDTRSKGRRVFLPLGILLASYYALHGQGIPVLCIGGMGLAAVISRHRGIFHRTWFIVLCCAVPVLYSQWYAPAYAQVLTQDMLFFCVGALSHVLLDFKRLR